MSYASIGIIAAVVLVITNQDVLFRRKGMRPIRAQREYRAFLLSILVFYVLDLLWGLLYGHVSVPVIFADTELYFIAMALTILFWTRYVVAYLDTGSGAGRALRITGCGYLALGLLAVALNPFLPVLFRFDASGVYSDLLARDLLLILQMVLIALTAVYVLYARKGAEGGARGRYRTIALYGAAMVLLILAQFLYPLLPFYSMGFLLGSCLLHAFVVEDEKEEYLRELEEALKREKEQQRELGSARQAARTDPLTGVKNKLAYLDTADAMDKRLEAGERPEFALAIFDLNGLKTVNDTLGHEAGDEYIIEGCRLICVHFKHSPVFRIGGDEFAALLMGQDYANRASLAERFDSIAEMNIPESRVVVSMGVSAFRPDEDASIQTVFERADKRMYERKQQLKEMQKTAAPV